MSHRVAGMDVHKKVLMVVVIDSQDAGWSAKRKRFGTVCSELRLLSEWLREQGVEEAVMESTAQYWKPVWYELESQMRLHLAQAFSNRAPKGRKHDFRDAERLVRRLLAGELTLSLVPTGEQRSWRTMTRMKTQLTEDQSRLHAQIESLLEEMRIKLSSVVSDLLGVSGLRILTALAAGQRDARKLAGLRDERLRASEETLVDALSGHFEPYQQQLLGFYLQRYQLIQQQIEQLHAMIGRAMEQHQQAVRRLAQVPGFGVNSAQQVIAEVGVQASTFASAAHLASWVGTCPGKEESAEKNRTSRSAKGNRYLRRILNQVAHAAVKKQGSRFQIVFRRLLPRLGYKGAIWAVAHRLCRLVWKILHHQIDYIETGSEPNPKAKQQRARKLLHALRKLGYDVNIPNLHPAGAES
jgi:transposase